MRAVFTALLRRRPDRPEVLPCTNRVHDETTLIHVARGALTREEQIGRVAATLCGADVGWACVPCIRQAERLVPALVDDPVSAP